jgi:hypothetical protein
MDVKVQSGMYADDRAREKTVHENYQVLSSGNPLGVITLPKIRGGVVTRMTILPLSGVIAEIDIETSESSISFPEEVRFDLNAKINIQRIIIVGGTGMDHQ